MCLQPSLQRCLGFLLTLRLTVLSAAQFHMEQAKLRAGRRLREGRPRPIDNLVRTLHLASEYGVDADPPYATFDKLGLADLHELQDSIHQLQVRLGHRSKAQGASPQLKQLRIAARQMPCILLSQT